MYTLNGINFRAWIDEHRHLLKPPVGNQQVFENAEFIVMVVGGPNARKDYHYNEGEEFFYQVEGDITLKVIDDGTPRDISIREGEIFLLPARVPHSPQRPAGTVGLVIERKRRAGELDGCFWFCESCGTKLHAEYFPMENIVTQLPGIMDAFYASEEKRHCDTCGAVMQPPTPVF
ncbi:MAG: 3-hydroxyanthranilate 3,4-dioxygenase [Bacteroidota bacterium]|jgi:3-hydroxyanthranilate 3,4-dioxygenase|nr:3-hydroxyanthranilate 3,4-dioxygenase [Bacteroidota bacterium]